MLTFEFNYISEKFKHQHTDPITIKCCAKIILSVPHAVNQICGVSEVRIRVLTSKVLYWDTIDGRVGRAAQLLTEYSLHIRSCHCSQRRMRIDCCVDS